MKARGYTKETITQMGVNTLPFPEFRVGDTVIVSQRIKEGDKERIQMFEGDVIAIRKKAASTTFTVRKIAHGVAVERIFPLYSPLVKNVDIVKKGDVRRAKLFYVRHRLGKSARLKEKIMTRDQKDQQALDKHDESVENNQK